MTEKYECRCYNVNNMLKLKFVTVGDIPRGPLAEKRDDFLKQLKAFVDLEHIVLKNESGCDKYLSDDFTIALTEHGKSFDSPGFSEQIKELEDGGRHVTVFLADAFGFKTDLPERVNLQISLSPMTFPHDFAHVLFLEQLYRAMTIVHGKKYHY